MAIAAISMLTSLSTTKAIRLCLCLPPHLTHILQPLDLVIFSLLKRAYSTKVDKYAACGITGIHKDYFIKILGKI